VLTGIGRGGCTRAMVQRRAVARGKRSGVQLARWPVMLVALALCPCAGAQVFAGTSGDSGAVVLSNFQSIDAPQLLIAAPDTGTGPAPAATAAAPARSSKVAAAKAGPDLRRMIDTIAAQVQISSDLLHAVIAVESNYDLKALSPRGAMGLMQLLPATAKRFGAKDPYAAAENVMAGATYLKWLMGLFDNDLELVLAAYNSGEQAVLKAGRKIPPYAETQAYVPRVMAQLQAATKASN